jgi:hypothetical protein
MPTFSSILQSLPEPPEKKPSAPKYLAAFFWFCLVLSGALVCIGLYWRTRALLYGAIMPGSLAIVAFLVHVFFAVKDLNPFFKDPAEWLAERLDYRFAQEKSIAAELARTELAELQRMRARLDADFIRAERWLDVLKPLSMLIPAGLVVVTVGIFKLPDFIQDFCKVLLASATIGAIVAVIVIQQGLVRLRTLSSALHYAIDLAEENKKPRFRKVSRKRGDRIA